MDQRSRRILAFTGTVSSVARAMPRAARVGPDLFGKHIPLVSGMIPLVSAVPPMSAPVYFGGVATRTAEDIPRRRQVPPSEMGLGKALFGYVLGAPLVLPIKMVQKIAEEVKAQAEVESDERYRLRGELLENAMRYEAGLITEEEYSARDIELRARLDQISDEGAVA
ncbi:MAG: gas vesicle protein GvpG [Dehalococcoidia bacterium]